MLDNQETLTQAVKSRNRWRAVAVASLILVLVVMLPFTIVMNDVFRTSWSKYLSARKVTTGTTGTTQTRAVTPKVKQLPKAEAKSKDPPSGKVTTGTAAVAEPVLYYESCGTGEPLILIHGGQLDCRMWDDQFQQFSQYFQVVRYDVRGYGKSDLPTRPYADEEDLLGLLQFLHIDKAHLVGLSLGGRIAIDFALQHPERVRSVVAAGPGLSGFNWSAEGERQAMVIVRAARDQGAEKAAELWLRDPYMTPAMENPALAKRLHRLALENARCWLVNPLLGRELQPPAANRLGDIRAPMLVIVGSRDVADIQAICKLLEKRVPGVKKIVVDGSGHLVNMEKPNEFNRAVLDFLKVVKQQDSPK